MRPIQVKCSCGEMNCKEWAIIELQGVVEPQSQQPNLNLQNLEIGRLCRSSSQETYTLTIVYHELTGSKVTLKKPVLVLKKVKGCDEHFDMIGVIRQKILFKTRPKALISNNQHQEGLVSSLVTYKYKCVLKLETLFKG